MTYKQYVKFIKQAQMVRDTLNAIECKVNKKLKKKGINHTICIHSTNAFDTNLVFWISDIDSTGKQDKHAHYVTLSDTWTSFSNIDATIVKKISSFILKELK